MIARLLLLLIHLIQLLLGLKRHDDGRRREGRGERRTESGGPLGTGGGWVGSGGWRWLVAEFFVCRCLLCVCCCVSVFVFVCSPRALAVRCSLTEAANSAPAFLLNGSVELLTTASTITIAATAAPSAVMGMSDSIAECSREPMADGRQRGGAVESAGRTSSVLAGGAEHQRANTTLHTDRHHNTRTYSVIRAPSHTSINTADMVSRPQQLGAIRIRVAVQCPR